VFTYDGDGNRVKQTYDNGTTTTVTLFLGGGLYTVEDAAGSPQVSKYYVVAGQRVAMEGADGLHYLLTDHLGSVVAVTDTSGALVEDSEQRYMPFGQPRLEANAQTDFGYTGQRALAGTGLMDYNARWYDAALGRFVSADSLVPGAGNPQAFNRYSYVLNNPIRLVDPSGNRACGDGEEIDCTGKLYITSTSLNKGCGGTFQKPCGGYSGSLLPIEEQESDRHIDDPFVSPQRPTARPVETPLGNPYIAGWYQPPFSEFLNPSNPLPWYLTHYSLISLEPDPLTADDPISLYISGLPPNMRGPIDLARYGGSTLLDVGYRVISILPKATWVSPNIMINGSTPPPSSQGSFTRTLQPNYFATPIPAPSPFLVGTPNP
jgi:RHS repeat-associated protein